MTDVYMLEPNEGRVPEMGRPVSEITEIGHEYHGTQ